MLKAKVVKMGPFPRNNEYCVGLKAEKEEILMARLCCAWVQPVQLNGQCWSAADNPIRLIFCDV